MENVGTSWNWNRRQKQRKNPEARKRNFRDRFSWLLPANNKSKSWRKNKRLFERVQEGGWGPACCHSNVLYRKSPDLSVHLGQHVPWRASWKGHQALGEEGSLSGHNAWLMSRHQLPSSCFPQQREMNPH